MHAVILTVRPEAASPTAGASKLFLIGSAIPTSGSPSEDGGCGGSYRLPAEPAHATQVYTLYLSSVGSPSGGLALTSALRAGTHAAGYRAAGASEWSAAGTDIRHLLSLSSEGALTRGGGHPVISPSHHLHRRCISLPE